MCVSHVLSLSLQDIIPQPLLDQYLSMTDPARAQTVDTEIAKHCAYSLPGVALTLGRQNWHCLKDTYETLASDVQVKKTNQKTQPSKTEQMEKSSQTRVLSSFFIVVGLL